MAERAQRDTTMAEHPDVMDLQRQYGQTLGTPQAVMSEGILALAGVWAAISPWILGFNVTNPSMMVNNLIVGLVAVAVGLGVTGTAERGSGLTWVAVPLGIWLIISLWVGPMAAPGVGLVWNNVVTGAVILLAGGVIAATTMAKSGRKG